MRGYLLIVRAAMQGIVLLALALDTVPAESRA